MAWRTQSDACTDANDDSEANLRRRQTPSKHDDARVLFCTTVNTIGLLPIYVWTRGVISRQEAERKVYTITGCHVELLADVPMGCFYNSNRLLMVDNNSLFIIISKRLFLLCSHYCAFSYCHAGFYPMTVIHGRRNLLYLLLQTTHHMGQNKHYLIASVL